MYGTGSSIRKQFLHLTSQEKSSFFKFKIELGILELGSLMTGTHTGVLISP